MRQVRRRSLPSEDEVWTRVLEFAKAHKENQHPVPTLREGVVNRISDVKGARIERVSDNGRTNDTPIMRGELLRVWRDLVANGHTRKARPNYFTLALLQAAMSDLIDDLGDGSIALRGHAPTPSTNIPYSYAEAASIARTSRARDARADFELRESDAHWNIKHYIHSDPNTALAKLSGGPWTPAALELPLRVPTSDRIDVVVKSASGRYVLIEVKPRVGERDHGLYAQAAKYRAIWQVLHDLDGSAVRCVLAAPEIPRAIARHMYSRHGIESVAVIVPPDYVAPPREDLGL
jgi:hypothetical protein